MKPLGQQERIPRLRSAPLPIHQLVPTAGTPHAPLPSNTRTFCLTTLHSADTWFDANIASNGLTLLHHCAHHGVGGSELFKTAA